MANSCKHWNLILSISHIYPYDIHCTLFTNQRVNLVKPFNHFNHVDLSIRGELKKEEPVCNLLNGFFRKTFKKQHNWSLNILNVTIIVLY